MLWNTLTVQNQYDLFKIIGFSVTIKWNTWMLDLKRPIIDLVEHLKTIYMWADFLQSKYNVTDYLKQLLLVIIAFYHFKIKSLCKSLDFRKE